MAKVAVFVDYYLPGFAGGGTPVSLSRIATEATDLGHDLRIITRDRDLGGKNPYAGAVPRTWQCRNGAKVAHLRPGYRDVRWLASQMEAWRPDFYYFNSLQSPWFSLLPFFLVQRGFLPQAALLVAPRGECSSGAYQLKRWKKRLMQAPIRSLLRNRVIWHASSELELADIERWHMKPFPKTHSSLVLVDPPPKPAASTSNGSEKGDIQVVFVSRIDEKKGLDIALDILQSIRQTCNFEVFGVISDEAYWNRCLQKAKKLPPNIRFAYRGEFRPEDSVEIFSHSDLLLFPTRGENFGHVIAEALAVGCPVAISGNTMWTTLVNTGCGFAGLTSEIQRYVNEFLSLPMQDRARLRKMTHENYVSWFEVNSSGGDLFALALEQLEKT